MLNPQNNLPTSSPSPAPSRAPGPSRGPHRPSMFSGLLLVLVGTLLLLGQFDPNFNLGSVIAHFWPVVIILLGTARLADRYARPPDSCRPALVTGSEFGLIILVFFLLGVVVVRGWVRGEIPRSGWDLVPFGRHQSETRRITVTKVGKPDSVYRIDSPSGSIEVQAQQGSGLNVEGTVSATAGSDRAARQRLAKVDLVFEGPDGSYHIHPVNAETGVSTDMHVALPVTASIAANTERGNLTVAGVRGSVNGVTRNGDIDIHDAGSSVTAQLVNGDAKIRNVGGDVHLIGRGGGDVDISDVAGAVSLSGNLFGNVDVRNAAKGVTISSPRSAVEAAALPGDLKVESGNVQLSRAVGPVSVTSHNGDVTLNDISGPITISNNRGNIELSFSAPPKSSVDISDDAGDITLNLPASSGFTLIAASHLGDLHNEFALQPENSDEGDKNSRQANATYGAGGPTMRVTSNYGDIHINKK